MISRRVTDPSQIVRIVRWLDALGQPGNGDFGCPANIVPDVTFTFRSASGAELARAYAPPARSGPCDPVQLTIPGKPRVFLDDPPGRESIFGRRTFIGRVQQLIGTKFVAKRSDG